MWLIVVFLAVPIIEIALFIQIGGFIGLWPTLGLVLLSAIIGTALLRSQGARALGEVQRSFADMTDPSRPLAHGVMIIIAGMLLLTPGFFTDALGLLLLIPAVRDAVMLQIAGRLTVTRTDTGSASAYRGSRSRAGDAVIDGDYVVEPEQQKEDNDSPDVNANSGNQNRDSGGGGIEKHRRDC